MGPCQSAAGHRVHRISTTAASTAQSVPHYACAQRAIPVRRRARMVGWRDSGRRRWSPYHAVVVHQSMSAMCSARTHRPLSITPDQREHRSIVTGARAAPYTVAVLDGMIGVHGQGTDVHTQTPLGSGDHRHRHTSKLTYQLMMYSSMPGYCRSPVSSTVRSRHQTVRRCARAHRMCTRRARRRRHRSARLHTCAVWVSAQWRDVPQLNVNLKLFIF